MQTNQLRGNFMLLFTALIWGFCFVAQKSATFYIGPLTFMAVRSFIAAIALFICTGLLIGYQKVRRPQDYRPLFSVFTHGKELLLGSIICGALLSCGNVLQQAGIAYTTAGKAGFISVLYIIIVPLLGIFFKRKVNVFIWVAVAVAAIGLYLLCINERFTIGRGDVYILLSAVTIAFDIILLDYFSPRVDGLWLSCLQFLVIGIICLPLAVIFEHPTLASVYACILPLLYVAVFGSAIAYTLEIFAQRIIGPAITSLILSLEAVFAALAGWLILDEILLPRELVGSALMLIAIILSQLPELGKMRRAKLNEKKELIR